MLNSSIIQQLDTKNVSTNTQVTKERFESIWNNTTNIKKNEAVSLGGYKDTRSFTNAKNSGQISVRMIIALSITFNVDPFWLNAEIDTRNTCTESSINKFLEKYGFQQFCSYNNATLIKQEMINYVSKTLNELTSENLESIEQLSDEEYLTLLKSLMIKSKNKSNYNLQVIKALLFI